MKKNLKRLALVALAITASIALASCGGDKTVTNNGSNKIDYWVTLPGNTAQVVSNLADTPLAQKLMETFDCEIEYQHPAQGQEWEKFNILVAGGELPDIVEFYWQSAYPGGPQKAIDDGVISEIDLKKDAPNLASYIEKHPEMAKMMQTVDGNYYGYPFIRGDEYLQTCAGFIIREDWCEELGLELPETIDEWEIVLKEFKEKKTNGKAPTASALVGASQGGFLQAFGVASDDLYVDDGVIKYGPMEDGFKDWLILMNDWYKKGYISADFVSGIDEQAAMLNNEIGVIYGATGGGIGRVMAAATEEGFSVTGAKFPVVNKGDKPMFGNFMNSVTNVFACITPEAENRELCAKLLDYGYSEEGIMLHNFGIEGESYELVDKEGYEGKYPQFTELITNDPTGLSMAVSMSRYTSSHAQGPFVQRKEYMEQYSNLPQQKKALENWMYTDASQHFLPPYTLSMEQANDIVTDRENVNTYKAEMVTKFIMGTEPIENFDLFRENLKQRGIEKIVKYNQEAYDRYSK